MKEVLFSLLLVAFGVSAMAQQRIQLRSADKAECVKSDMTSLKASFSFSTIEAQDYESEHGTFSWLSLANTVIGGNEGDPQIPVVNQLIAVPFGANPRIEITSYSTTDYRLEEFGMHTLVPRQPSLRKDKRPEDVPFIMNEAAYQTRGFRGEPMAVVNVVGTMRGAQLGKMTIEPVSYDPVNNTIRVFNDIEVTVHFDGADARATEQMLVDTYSPYFDIVYKQLFNGRAITSIYDQHPDLYNTPVKMLVVATSTYTNSTAFQNWLTWKKQKGINVEVLTVADNASASTIKTQIYSKYNTNHPTFLVIVGDETVVTHYSLWDYGSSYGNAATDLEYASVDGDVYHDMYMSRMPVSSTTELANLVNKILTYEKYTMSNPSYLNETLLIAGWDDYWTNIIGKPTIQYANNNYFNTAHGITPHVFITTASGQTTCYNYINNVGFINYTAHGDIQKWHDPQFTNSNVNSLTNNDKFFWAMGNCCLTANFKNAQNSQTCFGETMVRAANKGAWGYIGSIPESYWFEDFYFGVGAFAAVQGTNNPTVSGTTKGCYDAMFDDTGFNTLNSVPFIGNLAVSYAHAANYNGSVTDEYYWRAYQCFGDGSVMPYLKVPAANSVSHTGVLPIGANSYAVSADAGSYVSITVNNEIIGVAVVPTGSTSVSVPVTAQSAPGTAMIVVTRQQRQPYIGSINIVGGNQYDITVNQPQYGTISAPAQAYASATVTLTATPETGYCLSSWDVRDASNQSITVTNNQFTMPESNVTVTATFIPGMAVTLASVMNGTISADPVYALQGNTINLTATPATSHVFDSWVVYKTGDVNTTVTVTNNSFTMPNYPVTVSAIFNQVVSGDVTIGSGTSTSQFIPTYTYYDYSLTQQIYTSAEVGETGRITHIAFYVSANPSQRTIDIYMSHTSKSTFSSTSDWVSQGTSYRVVQGYQTFGQTGWNVIPLDTPFEYNGTDNLLITVDDNTGSWNSSKASFYVYSTSANRAHYTYQDDTDFNPASISANSSYNKLLTTNNQIKLTKEVPSTQGYLSVSPTSLSDFEAVSGISASNPQSITVVGSNLQTNLTITAPTGFEVSTTQNGTYNSTLTLTPSNGSIRTNVFVRLSVNASPGTYNDNLTLASGTTTATVSLSGSVTPGSGEQYAVNVNVSPAEGGTVTGEGTYYENTTCTLTATPSEHYTFGGWQLDGSMVSNDNPYSFTVTGDVSYTAVFTEMEQYHVNLLQLEGGTISADHGTLYSGETVTLTVTPATGYSLYAIYVFKTGDMNTLVELTDNSFVMPDFDVTAAATFVDGSLTNGDYVKVTSDLEDWCGEYLIVYESGNKAFDGGLTTLDASNNYITVTISDNTIASIETTDAAKFTIASATNNYTIQSASGYYIGRTNNSNGLTTSPTQAYTNTITYNNDGSINIIASGGAYLRYNNTTLNGNRFRYYKSNSYTQQKAIQLYKKTEAFVTPTHTLHFEANGGTGTMDDLTKNEFEPFALTANAFTKSGYTFVGWNTAADGTGDAYADGAQARLLTDMTLYAQWVFGELQVSYHLVTSVEQLVAGETYLIVNTVAGKALSTVQNANNRGAAAVTINNDVISTLGDACELTLGTANGNWTFYDANYNGTGGYLYAASSSSNYLRTQPTNDANGQWSISIVDGVATLQAQGMNTRNLLKYNSTNDLFSCYSSGQQDVSLFVRVEEVVVTQTVNLVQGWNWWTPTVEATLEDLEAGLGTHGIIIKTQTENVSYEDGEWMGDEITLTPGQMYKIKVNADCSFTFSGSPASGVTVTINPGSNWIGYPGSQAMSIIEALNGFTPAEGDVIKTATENTTFEDGEWMGDFDTLQPGIGYIYISRDTVQKTITFLDN